MKKGELDDIFRYELDDENWRLTYTSILLMLMLQVSIYHSIYILKHNLRREQYLSFILRKTLQR
jgi:hypothetical protein